MTGVLNGLSFVRGLRELVQAIFRCGHLIGDAIVQGSATSHMVPVEKGEGASVRTNTHTHSHTHTHTHTRVWIIMYLDVSLLCCDMKYW